MERQQTEKQQRERAEEKLGKNSRLSDTAKTDLKRPGSDSSRTVAVGIGVGVQACYFIVSLCVV